MLSVSVLLNLVKGKEDIINDDVILELSVGWPALWTNQVCSSSDLGDVLLVIRG